MNHRLIQLISSKKTTIVLLAIYIVSMATATVIEKHYGTPVAKALVYYSPLFVFLHLLMILNFILITVQDKLISKRKWSCMTIHFALIVMMTGAMVTHLFGKEGMMHIREGETSDILILKQGEQTSMMQLPFALELKDFRLTRYPGSQSPSSYESDIRVLSGGESADVKIYMNNVLDFKGYRFFQASYDQDEMGTILSVNHDVAGRTITYTGYLLLFCGLVLTLLDRHSRFRRLWSSLDKRLAVVLLILGCGIGSAANAQAQDLQISEAHADRFALLPLQSHNGRIVPVSTFASEIVRKFDIKDLIGTRSAEQFLLSLTAYPADWSMIPLVEIKDREVGKAFGWNQERISYRDAFDENGYYVLAKDIEKIYLKNPSERTRQDKELLKIDDRLNILHELLTDRMLRIFPVPGDSLTHRWIAGSDPLADRYPEIHRLSDAYLSSVATAGADGDWHKADSLLTEINRFRANNLSGLKVSDSRLKAEVYYNRLGLLNFCRFAYLIIGLCMIVLYVSTPGGEGKKNGRAIRRILLAGLILCFALHTLSLGMRWYISGYAPWSNSYETMVALSWAGILCGFIFSGRNQLVAGLATAFGGIVLLVSGLSWMDPQITPLVPVLKSPWLMAHVASLILAYGFLGICCMIGAAYLVLSAFRSQRSSNTLKQMTTINELSMQLGLGLMTIGIFLGAIWANESWGRYWSWDPKETWALISMIVYATVLHVRWFIKPASDRSFHLMAQLSFLAILMTFLGVNYFLSGMHSYGSHDALANIPLWAYICFIAFFTLPGILSFLFERKS